MLDKFVEEVFKKIIAQNHKLNHDAIPHSDIFEKEIQSLLGIDHPELERIIKILKDAHQIFSFEITKEDKDNDVKRIDGYVECDLQIIRKLKVYFQKLLMDEYEKQFNARLLVHQIVKDIYLRSGFYKNTLLGQIGNKAIMLEEYEGFIEKNFNEFTDSWKSRKLSEIIAQFENKLLNDKPPAANERTASPSASKRAIDSPQYKSFSSEKPNQSLDKVLQIYGVEFFFRINLRNCNFDVLRQVIESGTINRRADLTVLKEMIQKMKLNFDKDARLAACTDQIYKLERLISRQMLHSH